MTWLVMSLLLAASPDAGYWGPENLDCTKLAGVIYDLKVTFEKDCKGAKHPLQGDCRMMYETKLYGEKVFARRCLAIPPIPVK